MKVSDSKPAVNSQRGFSLLEIIIVVIVLAIIVLLGMTFMNRLNGNEESSTTNRSTSQVEEIKDEKGLEQAEATLDDINLEELDVSELAAAEADLL